MRLLAPPAAEGLPIVELVSFAYNLSYAFMMFILNGESTILKKVPVRIELNILPVEQA